MKDTIEDFLDSYDHYRRYGRYGVIYSLYRAIYFELNGQEPKKWRRYG